MNRLSDEEKLVKKHRLLVKNIAYKISLKLPKSIALDDLIQDGMIGLLDAAKKYDSSLGSSFETYASIRIRGNILDGLRNSNILPRGIIHLSQKIKKAEEKVQNKKLRPITNSEVAKEMDIPIKEFHKILNDIQQGNMISTENSRFTNDSKGRSVLDWYEDNNFNPEVILEIEEFVDSLSAFVKSLPERKQAIFTLSEIEGLSEREIGVLFGISESRVSQILAKVRNEWKAEQFAANLKLIV